MADAFLLLPAEDRREALSVAADRSGRPAHLLEKDAWVVWALATLYGSPLGEHLVFKGGTSLSKAYGVIRRFSEDVDLTYDIRALAPDLVGDNGEALPKTRSEEKRWTSAVRERLPQWVAEAVQPVIATSAVQRVVAGAAKDMVAELVACQGQPCHHIVDSQRLDLLTGRELVVGFRVHRVDALAAHFDHPVAGIVDVVPVVAGPARQEVGACAT